MVLGGFGWQALLPVLADAGWRLPRPRPAFAHAAHVPLGAADGDGVLHLFASYHPSRRNISTRTLTPAMLRDVLHRAAAAASLPTRP